MNKEDLVSKKARSLSRHHSIVSILKVFLFFFHPLLLPSYFFLILRFFFVFDFPNATIADMNMRGFSIFFITCFFPMFSCFILWRLKLTINTLALETMQERIVPLIVTSFFYWWYFYLSRNFNDQPVVLEFYFLGIFFAASAVLVLNSFFDISFFIVGLGTFFSAIIFVYIHYHFMFLIVPIVMLLTGLLLSIYQYCYSLRSARFIYCCFGLGIISQVLAYFVLS
ncbi:MAG: hypothetical protein QM528_05590 [Phycisphaerales bacterium]|nr:hypothetical protein [Phycisphaerales bacterium]